MLRWTALLRLLLTDRTLRRKWIKTVLVVINLVRVATWLFSFVRIQTLLNSQRQVYWVCIQVGFKIHSWLSIIFSFRACLMGLSTGCICFATLYLGQRHFTRQLKGTRMSVIALSSTFFACVTGNSQPQLECSNKTNSLNWIFSGYLIVDAKLTDCSKSLKKQVSCQK